MKNKDEKIIQIVLNGDGTTSIYQKGLMNHQVIGLLNIHMNGLIHNIITKPLTIRGEKIHDLSDVVYNEKTKA